MRKVLLYSTLGCHLCEQAIEQISPVVEVLGLCIQEVDIADNETLLERYGVRIPVIQLEHTELELGWPFDTEQAYQFLLAQM